MKRRVKFIKVETYNRFNFQFATDKRWSIQRLWCATLTGEPWQKFLFLIGLSPLALVFDIVKLCSLIIYKISLVAVEILIMAIRKTIKQAIKSIFGRALSLALFIFIIILLYNLITTNKWHDLQEGLTQLFSKLF